MVTADTNIAIYAMERDGFKASRAKEVIASLDFLSVQTLNEYAYAVRRKLRREWGEIVGDLEILSESVPAIHPVHAGSNREALKIAERYRLQFFDALMIAVALENGATILYSEDMQHGLVIDGTLTITNPFLPAGSA